MADAVAEAFGLVPEFLCLHLKALILGLELVYLEHVSSPDFPKDEKVDVREVGVRKTLFFLSGFGDHGLV